MNNEQYKWMAYVQGVAGFMRKSGVDTVQHENAPWLKASCQAIIQVQDGI